MRFEKIHLKQPDSEFNGGLTAHVAIPYWMPLLHLCVGAVA